MDQRRSQPERQEESWTWTLCGAEEEATEEAIEEDIEEEDSEEDSEAEDHQKEGNKKVEKYHLEILETFSEIQNLSSSGS